MNKEKRQRHSKPCNRCGWHHYSKTKCREGSPPKADESSPPTIPATIVGRKRLRQEVAQDASVSGNMQSNNIRSNTNINILNLQVTSWENQNNFQENEDNEKADPNDESIHSNTSKADEYMDGNEFNDSADDQPAPEEWDPRLNDDAKTTNQCMCCQRFLLIMHRVKEIAEIQMVNMSNLQLIGLLLSAIIIKRWMAPTYATRKSHITTMSTPVLNGHIE